MMLSSTTTRLARVQTATKWTRYASSKSVYICGAARTPVGSMGKSLAPLTAVQLGVVATQGALMQAGLDASNVDEIIYGNVISAGLGQSPARQVALLSGCPNTTEATTINKVCASGMKSVMLAAQNIMLGSASVMLAGGMESMSNVPYALRTLRNGARYGHQQVDDLVLADGLTDAFNNIHMGLCGEDTAEKLGITREECDEYALQSYAKSNESVSSGRFDCEIAPVEIPQRKGSPKVVSRDEECFNINTDRVPTLRSVFKKDGVITAANASTLNDGAVTIVLADDDGIAKNNLTPKAKILGFSDGAIAPIEFPIAPAKAVKAALDKAGLTVDDIDMWEVNEAFAVVALANIKLLGLDASKVNKFGGAVSLGHPIGMSGGRIVGTLVHQLESGQIGCASICNGGGAASAIILQKL